MNKIIPLVGVLMLSAGPAAFAQTPATEPSPKSPAVQPTQPLSPPARTSEPTMTDQQAKQWIDKTVYSSDGVNVGEVSGFQRDSSGKVIEMHADIGGFLGIGETRVRLMPAQFKLESDRVVLNMTSAQAKGLPKITVAK